MKFSNSILHPSNWFFSASRRYRLEVSASENNILKIRDFAQAVCRAAGYLPADSNIVLLVLEEICVNVVQGAYAGRTDGKIQLEMSIGMMGLKIRISDQGQTIDFNGMRATDMSRYVKMVRNIGWGLWFMQEMTAKIYYRAYSDHNDWILYYRPSGNTSRDEARKKGLSSLSFKFIFASFVLFSFLIFLVYVLFCLFIVPTAELNDSVVQRIIEGSKTSLSRGILLVYGLGLVGFFLIFYKLFNPFLEAQRRRFSEAAQNNLGETGLQDQGEYERLVGVISEMEDRLRESESKIVDQEKIRLEMRIIENARQEELRTFESTRREETQAVEKARSEAAMATERTDEEIERFSEIKEGLNRRLKEAQTKIAEQEKIQTVMQKEVKAVEQIKQSIFSGEIPKIEGFQVGVSYRAAKEAKGNYYDFIWVNPMSLGITVGDVWGNDAPGFIAMTAIRAAMRLEARDNMSPANVLLKVHQHVSGDMEKGEFATLSYMILDARNRSINFASTGKKPMILYRKSEDEIYFLKPKGFPLGTALPDNSFMTKTLESQKLYLQKDDVLIICTEGVIEVVNPEKEKFGEKRLMQGIRDNAHLSAEELVRKLRSDIVDFAAGVQQDDDITILAIKENWPLEDAIYAFRKNLLSLVEQNGVSIIEACRKTGVPAQTYYCYKNIYDKKGEDGLRPVFSRKNLKELSATQKTAVISVVKSHPELEPNQISAYLKKNVKPSLRLKVKVISEFLSWKGLDESEARKVFAANEIDTV